MKHSLDAIPTTFSHGEDKDTDKEEMSPHDDAFFEP